MFQIDLYLLFALLIFKWLNAKNIILKSKVMVGEYKTSLMEVAFHQWLLLGAFDSVALVGSCELTQISMDRPRVNCACRRRKVLIIHCLYVH